MGKKEEKVSYMFAHDDLHHHCQMFEIVCVDQLISLVVWLLIIPREVDLEINVLSAIRKSFFRIFQFQFQFLTCFRSLALTKVSNGYNHNNGE